jgi:hypothetical protein
MTFRAADLTRKHNADGNNTIVLKTHVKKQFYLTVCEFLTKHKPSTITDADKIYQPNFLTELDTMIELCKAEANSLLEEKTEGNVVRKAKNKLKKFKESGVKYPVNLGTGAQNPLFFLIATFIEEVHLCESQFSDYIDTSNPDVLFEEKKGSTPFETIMSGSTHKPFVWKLIYNVVKAHGLPIVDVTSRKVMREEPEQPVGYHEDYGTSSGLRTFAGHIIKNSNLKKASCMLLSSFLHKIFTLHAIYLRARSSLTFNEGTLEFYMGALALAAPQAKFNLDAFRAELINFKDDTGTKKSTGKGAKSKVVKRFTFDNDDDDAESDDEVVSAAESKTNAKAAKAKATKAAKAKAAKAKAKVEDSSDDETAPTASTNVDDSDDETVTANGNADADDDSD